MHSFGMQGQVLDETSCSADLNSQRSPTSAERLAERQVAVALQHVTTASLPSETRSSSFAWHRKFANVTLEVGRGLQTRRDTNCRGVIASHPHLMLPSGQPRRAHHKAALALSLLTPAALLSFARCYAEKDFIS